MDTDFALVVCIADVTNYLLEGVVALDVNTPSMISQAAGVGLGNLSCIKWLSLIKLFELELSVRKMAEQMNLAYNTVYRAVKTIRCAILAHSHDANDLLGGEIELDECYFGGRRKDQRGCR